MLRGILSMRDYDLGGSCHGDVVADSNISAHSHISPYLVWSLLTMTPFPDTHGNKI